MHAEYTDHSAQYAEDCTSSQPQELAAEIKSFIDAISIKGLASCLSGISIQKLSERELPSQPGLSPLKSKVATQADLESDWGRYWIHELGFPFSYNRKMWEYAFILQALSLTGMLQDGRLGLGLGCGKEPLPSYLAAQGCNIVAGDKPAEKQIPSSWQQIGTYTESLESLFWERLLSKSEFEKRVQLQYVDMNDLPSDIYGQFDFCWSVCAVEHLGSIKAGLDFLLNSIKALKPGGVSVHTLEFNYLNIPKDFETPSLCFFKAEHMESLSEEIKTLGATLCPLDFDWGNMVFDRYIDLPPYNKHRWDTLQKRGLNVAPFSAPHLKLNYTGIPITCFGVIAIKS